MGQSQTFINSGANSYGDAIRESLKDFIARVSWEKTPFLTLCGKSDATAVAHSWLTEALGDAADNAQVSGFAVTFAASDANLPTKVTNQVQILMRKVSVDKTMEWVNKVNTGTGSLYDRQIHIKSRELSLDLDRELLTSGVVTRADDTQTGGEMRGLILATTSNVENLNNAGLLFDTYLRLCKAIAEAGGDADYAIMNGDNKLIVDSWSSEKRQWNMKDKELAQVVNVITSGFSSQAVLFDKHMTSTDVVLFSQKMNYVAYGRPFSFDELKPDADRRGGYVVTEATLEHRNEKSGGKITGIKN